MGDENQYARPSHEQTSSTQTAPGSVSSRTEDVLAAIVGVLTLHNAKPRRWPAAMPRDYVQAAHWWLKMQEPPDERFEKPREMPIMGKGDSATRMEYPYIRRVCATLRKFLMSTEAEQRIIVAAREDGIYRRGEDGYHFPLVIREVELQRELGPEEYRKQAIERIRRMKVGGKLPYDKVKRYD